MKCGYPKKMVANILDSMKKKPRLLQKKQRDIPSSTENEFVVVSTFGRDKKLTKILDQVQSNSKSIKFEYIKKQTPLFKISFVNPKTLHLALPMVKQ